MSGYSGRRGPALYPNIANLNAIPSDPDHYNMVMQRQQDGYELEQELALFTNTQFFDFDSMSPEGFDNNQNKDNFNLLTDDFQIPDLGLPSSNLGSNSHSNLQPHQAQQLHYQQSFNPTTSSSPASPSGNPPPVEKRKIESYLESGSTNISSEETSRLAADEDKRRRNTAASARFRAKKKQREEAMEKTAKEMTEKVAQLEARIAKLEMENKLLKDLVTEKNGKEDVAELYRRLAKTSSAAKKADLIQPICNTTKPVARAEVASR